MYSVEQSSQSNRCKSRKGAHAMKGKTMWLGILLLVSVLVISGCGAASSAQ